MCDNATSYFDDDAPAAFQLTPIWIAADALMWARYKDDSICTMTVRFRDGTKNTYTEPSLGVREMTIDSPVPPHYQSPPLGRQARHALLAQIQDQIAAQVNAKMSLTSYLGFLLVA